MMPARINYRRTLDRFWLAGIALVAVWVFPAQAELIDPGSPEDPWLDALIAPLHPIGIDVMRNLNHRDLVRGRLSRPRLGKFPDLPINSLPATRDLLAWEAHYSEGEIGGLAIYTLAEDSWNGDLREIEEHWFSVAPEDRVFISYAMADVESAMRLQTVFSELGFGVLSVSEFSNPETGGRLFVTAGRRLALDSNGARGLRSELSEFNFLGERLPRNSTSLFDSGSPYTVSSRNEPAVFRKQSLGDEFTASTIEEIIVPGGIALGEKAILPVRVQELRFKDGRFGLLDDRQILWQLPDESPKVLKALFDFVSKSEAVNSDSIVDIDGEGRVKISSAFRDTDVGYEMIKIDALPFEFVSNIPVVKSVIVDKSVEFVRAVDSSVLHYDTVYEVRFLSADSMRIAQTRAAIEYMYSSVSNAINHERNWGRESSRLDKNLDYSGLGFETAPLARYAAWIALIRNLLEDDVKFLSGRYEFMKIDKSGRRTPSRY